MKRIILLSLVTSSLLLSNEYQDWLNQQSNQYSSYKKSIDQEFSDMLKKDWESFNSMSTPPSYKKPKPKIIPEVKKEVTVSKKEIEKSPLVKIPITAKPKVVKKKITIIKKPYILKDFKTIDLNFYSESLSIQYDIKSAFYMGRINKNIISKYWEQLSKTKFKKLISQIDDVTNRLNLNDWAKYQLIYKLGYGIYEDNNISNLFTWFILVKMNYDIKIGYSGSNIYLLSPVKHKLYQTTFFNLDDIKYYILNPNGKSNVTGSVYTYKGKYPKSTNILSFKIDKPILLNQNIKQKDLSFVFERKKYNISVNYSTDLVKFYSTFPQSDYKIYYDTKNSTKLNDTLLVELSKAIKGKTEIEAVNLLLRFVQTAFKYKTDQTQFNNEKVMFPEETVYYPYSDCEDRSIMFNYLVKRLLSLNVVGVRYTDHLASAVELSSTIKGSKFNYKNKTYTITDPTYINANAGMVMPKYKNSNFKVIEIQ